MFHGRSAHELGLFIDSMLEQQGPLAVMAAAAELQIFDELRTPTTAEALSCSRDLPREPLERLLCGLVALGLASRDEVGRFSATPAANAALGARGTHSSALRFQTTFVSPLLGRLADAVRSGRPQHRGWPFVEASCAAAPYEELAKHPEHFAVFTAAMDADARGQGIALARLLDLGALDRVVEGGGGGGVVARELLQAIPELHVDTFDLAPAVAIARLGSEEAGLTSRHKLWVGDVREEWPCTGATVALLAGVLSDFAEPEQRRILACAKNAVVPGGRLVLCERLLGDEGTSPASTALFSLVLLAGTEGAQLRRGILLELLDSCGWDLLEIHPLDAANPSGRSVVVARAR